MHTLPLTEIALILVSSLISLLIFQKLKVPEIVGFLITGVIIGPHAIGLVQHGSSVDLIAELGVILLLFTLGLEFSLKNLIQIRRLVFVGGMWQVGLTIAICTAGFVLYGFSSKEALFLGCLISLSSTALVLKVLEKRGLISSPVGNLSVAILLFQDLAIVPMILLVPLLGGSDIPLTQQFTTLLINLAIFAVSLFALRAGLPILLKRVTQSRSQELFIITVFSLCIGAAWGTGALGMSMALGAFAAGMLLSESPYGYQAFNTVHSFKELFSGFFFISVGMLLDIPHSAAHWDEVAVFIGAVAVIKLCSGAAAIRLLGYPVGTAMTVALVLSQIGEFSFVLSRLGLSANILSADVYQNFLAAGVITMIIGPFVIKSSAKLSERVTRLLRQPHQTREDEGSKMAPLKDHLVIIGFGVNGRNLAHAARSANVPYSIIEMNPTVVAAEQKNGEPILFGDASYPHVLEKVHIAAARVVAVAISDPFATRRIVDTIHQLYPSLHLIVRTRMVDEVEPLLKLGADEVVPEEFETSLEIFARVLRKYLVDQATITRLANDLRRAQYSKLLSDGSRSSTHLSFPRFEIEALIVGERFGESGKTLSDLDLRKRYGVTVIAIQRGEQMIENPAPSEILAIGDFVYLLGDHQKLQELARILEPV